MSTTISTSGSLGVSFGVDVTSPLTVTSSGTIFTGSGDAVYAGPGYVNPTVVNQGIVQTNDIDLPAILFKNGGSIDNTGEIGGKRFGVVISGAAGTVTNTGIIQDVSFGAALQLYAGGTVVNNGPAAYIRGDFEAIVINGGSVTNSNGGRIFAGTYDGIAGAGAAPTTVFNIGASSLIEGTGSGIYLRAGGDLVINTGTIEGSASATVWLKRGGTVVNAGTITAGASGTAVDFGNIIASNNRLVLYPGYYMTGFVKGGPVAGSTNTLELGSAASSGVLIDLNPFSNFGTLQVDSGAQWTLPVDQTSGTGGLILSVFGKLTTGTITNTGTITGSGALIIPAVINSGLIQPSVTATGGGAVTNNGGTILSTGIDSVRMTAGGVITNTGGLIQGSNNGVRITGAAGTVTNTGTIAATNGNALVLAQGGRVANSGAIRGTGAAYTVVAVYGGAITNSQGGYIGPGGMYIAGGATLSNAGTVLATSAAGVRLGPGGTVVDSGTISGGAGAVELYGAGNHQLVLEHGYQLTGGVQGSGGSNQLMLSGALGAVTVDFDKAGAGFGNFGTVAFGGAYGNDEILKITNTAALPSTIAGFTQLHEIVDLTQLNPVGASATLNGSAQLVASNGSQTVSLQLDSENYSGVVWQTGTDGSGGTDVSVACFCRGTLILTPDGEVAVEALAIGDRAVTMSGEARSIRWIGRRAYDGRFIDGNRKILPIRIAADALAVGVPARDLFVSPEHSLYLDGVLVQAMHLVNGATIVQAERVDQVEYFHIEFDTHDVIYADGAPAETFVDCDNRLMFANGAEYSRLYPDDDRPGWEFCLPRLGWGSAELSEIRAALLWRAEALGHNLDDNPDLHLFVDGERIEPDNGVGPRYRFSVPAGARDVRLASRRTVPAEVSANTDDVRRLGVAVERLVLSDADLSIEVWHSHSGLKDGFHEDEEALRWTDGLARLPDALLRPFAGAWMLEINLVQNGLGYRVVPHPDAAAVA